MSFSKSEIALAEAARAISAFWKTHKCKLIPNWTRKTVWLRIQKTSREVQIIYFVIPLNLNSTQSYFSYLNLHIESETFQKSFPGLLVFSVPILHRWHKIHINQWTRKYSQVALNQRYYSRSKCLLSSSTIRLFFFQLLFSDTYGYEFSGSN